MAQSVQLLDDAEDGSPLTIATVGDIITDFSVDGEQLVQQRTSVRAAEARPINRGNFAEKLTLGIMHAPAASPEVAKQNAVALLIAVRAKLATATLLRVTFHEAVFQLSYATLPTYRIVARGTTVRAAWNWLGGVLTEFEEV